MKYLHSGYVLFCDKAEHAADGRVNAHGLFDLFIGKSLPLKMNCDCIIGFGTPYERRQYKGLFILEDPNGREVYSHEFNANDPDDIYKGHFICHPEVTLNQEGIWTAKVFLKNWKNEGVWDIQRQFWVTEERDAPPDP